MAFAEPEVGAVRTAMTTMRPKVLILDLALPEPVRVEAFALAGALQVPVIAFGSHVDKRVLSAAKQVGAAEVLSRGALAHGLAPLIAKHLARDVGIGGPSPS